MNVKIYAAWVQHKWDSAPDLSINLEDLAKIYEKSEDTIAIAAGEFTLDLDIIPLDRAELAKTQVATLQREAGKHQAALTEITARINEILCLEHKS